MGNKIDVDDDDDDDDEGNKVDVDGDDAMGNEVDSRPSLPFCISIFLGE